MAMLGVEIAPIVVPFVQVALLAHGIWMQAVHRLAQLFAESRWPSVQNFVCGSRVGEQFAQYGEVCRTAIHRSSVVAIGRNILVFGRCAGRSNQLARFLGVFNKPLQHKVARPLHQRVERVAKIMAVARKVVLFPKVAQQPSSSEVPVGPFRTFSFLAHGVCHGPQVGVMARTPALVDAVIVSCSVTPIYRQRLHHAYQRRGQFGQIGHLRRPIVLFEVDINCVITSPRCPNVRIPKPLQVGRHARCAR